MIPIISLWQPWALLLVTGAKRIETRHWPLRLPLPAFLAIHAAKKWTAELYGLCRGEPFARRLSEAGVTLPVSSKRIPRPRGMEFGAVVGVVRVAACWPSPRVCECLEVGRRADELAFGDYSFGRWGWITDARLRLAQPLPLAGHQGIWQWQPAEEAARWMATLGGAAPSPATPSEPSLFGADA